MHRWVASNLDIFTHSSLCSLSLRSTSSVGFCAFYVFGHVRHLYTCACVLDRSHHSILFIIISRGPLFVIHVHNSIFETGKITYFIWSCNILSQALHHHLTTARKKMKRKKQKKIITNLLLYLFASASSDFRCISQNEWAINNANAICFWTHRLMRIFASIHLDIFQLERTWIFVHFNVSPLANELCWKCKGETNVHSTQSIVFFVCQISIQTRPFDQVRFIDFWVKILMDFLL